MISEIISIGDEILIGQIVNNNAAWMAQQLNLAGIPVGRITTVGDNREELLKIFLEVSQRADVVLITGGLGPTSDDITKPCLCEFFQTRLVFKEDLFEDVKRIFAGRNLPMPEMNRHQAEVPENCIPIRNHNGTAPGMWFEVKVGSWQKAPDSYRDGKNNQFAHRFSENNELPTENNKSESDRMATCIFVSLPGVPYEMKAMMNEFVIPELTKRVTQSIIHKTVYTQGLGESTLAEKIKTWEDSLAGDGIKLAYLPSPGMVKLRLSSSGGQKEKMAAVIDKKIADLEKIIPGSIFSVEEFGKEPETLEKVIGDLLHQNKKTLATAESCTGGYIGHLITSVVGSSEYYKGGVISYSNEVKINALGVDEQTLEAKGAVSKEVAEQMAAGARKRLHADYGISTTGVAGPSGGSPEKPVGTVWIAVATEREVIAEKFTFGNNRERNIRRAALAALNMLRKSLNDL